MKKYRLLLLLLVLSASLTSLFAQEKDINVQEYLTEEKLNTQVKEYFVRELRKTGLVKPIDNHEMIHFFIDRYESKYKALIKNQFETSKTLNRTTLQSEVVSIVYIIANNFNEYKIDHPNNPEEYNKNVNIRHFDLFDLGSETYKGPGQPCNNADFETNNATGWDLSDGQVNANPYEYVNVTATGLNAQHVIQTGGNDPIVGAAIPMVFPGGGGTSLQLGDGGGTGGLASGASQTFLVDANSAAFTYSYALVMEDPAGHTNGEKPFFKVNMYDQNGDPIACGDYEVISGPVSSGGDPDFVAYGAGPTGYYLPWRTTFAPLQAYIGQNVTIEFITGDCSQSGHYGYGYIDASCEPLEIIPDQTVICGGQPVTLSAPAGAASYAWTPNGETTQSITTNVPGHYEVTVIPVTGAACGLTLTADIGGSPDYPVASFDPSPTNVCLGTAIDFTNNSFVVGTSAIDSVQWDFDSDGTIDNTTMNPSYTYPATGNYTATLIVWNNGCQDDTTMNVTITPGTIADFTVPAVCIGAPSVFTDVSTPGAVVGTWEWDFDNNGTVDNSTQNPSYTFPSAGTFPVELSVSDAFGNCGHDTIINVIVHPKPVADFTVNDTCLTMANQFTDASSVTSGAITGWEWDFDNNGTVDNGAQNPTNTYGAAGTQTIELVVITDNTCRDTIVKAVEIFANPIAAFTSDTACENGISTMTDGTTLGSIGISNWDWDFDANATIDDVSQNPTNTFGVAGNYPVTLNIIDSNGCTSSITEDVIVAPNPTAAFTFSDECFGAATDFTDASNGNGGTIDAWNWDFTDNGTVDNTSQNPSNGYPAAGNYTTELLVVTTQGCIDSTTVNIDVDAIPVANFGAPAVCLGSVTMLYDSSAVSGSNVDQWSWDFGDAIGTSVAQNPTYTYGAIGPYNVTLTATSDSGCINTIVIPVDVSPNPIANFTSDTACSSFVSSLVDASTLGIAGIETWEWDFDNNATVDDGNQNPTFTYAGAGTYPVNLNVIDSFGCSHDTTMNVLVSENPIAAFVFSDECFGTATTFTDQSLDNGGLTPVDTWEWDFDNDGTIDDSNQNPTNIYALEGVYTAELLITTVLGCKDSITVSVDVDAIPVANFGGTNECFGNITTFTDSSSTTIGNVNQWDWDFGDLSPIDNNQNPTHQYAASGIYNVSLTVVSDSGCTHTFNTNVEVYDNPVANFTPDTVCNTYASNFIDVSALGSFGIETWEWDFDNDGATDDNAQNPSYAFSAAGGYPVNLNVVDSFGCTHDTTITITVSENPIANFAFTSECYGTATTFTNQSIDNGGTTPIDTWEWDFDGDGVVDNSTADPTFVFPAEGTYNTEILVTSVLGCVDSITIPVTVNPIPVAHFGIENVCLNTEGTFNDSSSVVTGSIVSWSWDFGDALGTSVQPSPSYTYTSAGTYNVTLSIVSDSGCTHNETLPVDIFPNPIANFDTTDVCLNVAAQFTDQSVGNGGTITGWSWDFENDGIEDDVNTSPSHNYPSDGTYDVELIVSTSTGCNDTLLKTVTIHPMPTADFTFVNSCLRDTVYFTDNSNVTSGTIDQWDWDLGNNQTSSDQNPQEVYAFEGVFDVELVATTNNGCSDTIVRAGIEVWPLPVVDFDPTTVCLNFATQFTDLSTVSNANTVNNNVQWSWDFDNGPGSTSSNQNPIYTFLTDGVFNTTLIVTTNNNCVDSITKAVTVHPQPVVDFVGDTLTKCTPVNTTFTDLTTLNGGDMSTSTWEWDVDGDGMTDLYGQNPLYSFTNESNSSVQSFDIKLTVTSEHGCVDSITKTNYINSYPIPLASFSFYPDDDASIVDNEIEFTDQSIIASTWQWDLGDGTTTTVINPVHEYADTGYYWATLVIENEYGCVDSTAKLVRINPIYAIWIPNAFTPNSDFTNDFFYVDGYGIKELQVLIFDRWGLKIYEGIGLDQAWDGTYKGELVPTDVYVYKVRAKDVFDEWHDYIGKVTVLK